MTDAPDITPILTVLDASPTLTVLVSTPTLEPNG